MNGVQLSEVDQEKDLGVIISNDLRLNLQCKEVIKKKLIKDSLAEPSNLNLKK